MGCFKSLQEISESEAYRRFKVCAEAYANSAGNTVVRTVSHDMSTGYMKHFQSDIFLIYERGITKSGDGREDFRKKFIEELEGTLPALCQLTDFKSTLMKYEALNSL